MESGAVPAVRLWVTGHPLVPRGDERSAFRDELAIIDEQLFGLIRLHPGLQQGEVFLVGSDVGKGDLVRAPEALDGDHLLREAPLYNSQRRLVILSM